MSVPPADAFLSGRVGNVTGRRARARARVLDTIADVSARRGARTVARSARSHPVRRVLVLALQRLDVPNLLDAAERELRGSRHTIVVVRGDAAAGGKFENLGRLLTAHPPTECDWLLVIDDDVTLPPGFLDRFVFLAEHFDLALAQPAHRFRSHAAWPVTRRRPESLVRETGFVEIGPLVAFSSRTFATLLPFPPLRFGWGLDSHWSAVARDAGWRMGVVDATPIEHVLRPVASSYPREAAVQEARAFLRDRPYVPGHEAARTLVTHRRL